MTIYNSSVVGLFPISIVDSNSSKKDENYTESSEYGDDEDDDGGGQGILRKYQDGLGGRGHGHGHGHQGGGGGGDDDGDDHFGCGLPPVPAELQNAMDEADMPMLPGANMLQQGILGILGFQVPQAVGEVHHNHNNFCS